MNLLEGLKTAIMLRKSRTDIEEERKARERGETYDTLKRHRKELLSFARRNKLDIVDIYEEVVSGDKIADRPQMQLMLERVKNNEYDAVLVVAYDRLGRGDKMDQGYMERIFKESYTIIITPKEIIDLNSEKGEMTADIEGFIARMEYRRIRTRLNDGKIRATKEGRDIGGNVAYGYAKDKEKKLEIVPEEAKIVQWMYERCVEGVSCMRMEIELAGMGVLHRNGSRFKKDTIRTIIKNPKYKGYQHFGDKKNKKILVPNSHEPIVSDELWELANKKISERNPPNNKNAPMSNPLSSILACSKCNRIMTRRHTSVKGIEYCYFYCKEEYCKKNAGVKEHELIQAILNYITDTLHSIEVEYIPDESNSNLPVLQNQLSELNKKLQTYTKRRNRIHVFYEDGEYSKEMFMERKAAVDEEEKETLAKIEHIKEQIQNETNMQENISSLAPAIRNTLELFHQCNPEQKNRLLRSFIKEIRYTRPTKQDEFTIEIFYHE